MTEILYLNWDREQRGEATELFHDLHGFDEKVETFDPGLYREVREIDTEYGHPETVWEEWNRGSGLESEEFLETLFCENCETHQIGESEAFTHAVQNHGYDSDEYGLPDYVHGERSMSVGDVVQLEDTYHLAKSIGWEGVQPE